MVMLVVDFKNQTEDTFWVVLCQQIDVQEVEQATRIMLAEGP